MPVSIPLSHGLEAAYRAHLPAAMALPESRLTSRQGDFLRAHHNFFVGLKALEPHWLELERRWNPGRVQELKQGAGYADAALFAARRAEELDEQEKQLRKDIAQAYVLRGRLLGALEIAALFELLPPNRVASIRSGRGSRDTCLDLISCVALYREFAAVLEGKTPITPAHLEEAEQLGRDLLKRIKPSDQKSAVDSPASADEKAQALNIARRFWTLLANAHHEARMAGRELFGGNVSQHIPPLQARLPQGRSAESTPETGHEPNLSAG